MLKNKIIYDLETGALVDLIIPIRLITGQKESVQFEIYFKVGDACLTDNEWIVTTIFERPDGEKTNEILATIDGDHYNRSISSFITDVEGVVKLTTHLNYNGTIKPFGIVYLPVDSGLKPTSDTITDAQYQALTDSLNGLANDLNDTNINVDNILNDLSDHKNDMNNPHNITAHQINAYTKHEVDRQASDTLQDAKDYADEIMADEHAELTAIDGRVTQNETDITDIKGDVATINTNITDYYNKQEVDYKLDNLEIDGGEW